LTPKTQEPSESVGNIPHDAERDAEKPAARAEAEPDQVHELDQEIMDLRITNRAKDMFIEKFQKEREGFALERQGYVEKLMTFNRKVGELETRLLQLSAPRGNVPNTSEMTSHLEAGAESALLASPSEQFGS
jgi:predicted RNase H-like nuclease (RuvC/YqgF family)